MRLHRNAAPLLLVSAAVATDQSGDVYRILPNAEDGVDDKDQAFQVYFKLTQAGGATSPTVQLKLQTSLDRVSWVDVVLSTQLAADGSKVETKDGPNGEVPLLPFVRAVSVLGGATKPNHTAEVRLLSSAAFTLKKVA